MKKPEGIGGTAMRLLRLGATNKEALEGVLRVHPEARTTMKSIRWYRNRLLNDFDAPRASDAPGLPPDKMPPKPAAPTPRRASSPEPGRGDVRTVALALVRDLVRRWRTNEQVLSTVLEAYPGARVTGEDVRTVRAELRRAGEYVPTSAEARRFLVGEARPTDPTPPASVLREARG
ncbi:hypothetical protein [Litorisediminicola beolgyonensis]|uniref:Uncharacterized protein n=1 Tax=Litorisediminicola beolgyonensis TaxID=1173614 RepID=A0ABW3ZNQ4_9RHOB